MLLQLSSYYTSVLLLLTYYHVVIAQGMYITRANKYIEIFKKYFFNFLRFFRKIKFTTFWALGNQ